MAGSGDVLSQKEIDELLKKINNDELDKEKSVTEDINGTIYICMHCKITGRFRGVNGKTTKRIFLTAINDRCAHHFISLSYLEELNGKPFKKNRVN